MKYLQDYMTERQSAAFEKAGAFFAFGDTQFKEKAIDGVKYVSLGAGLICDVNHAESLAKELDTIYKESIKQDIEENGLNAIIRRELSNHECYYTGDITDCIEKLEDYPVSPDDIRKVFNNQRYQPEILETL